MNLQRLTRLMTICTLILAGVPGVAQAEENTELTEEMLQDDNFLKNVVSEAKASEGFIGNLPGESSTYTLGVNDVIQVAVMRHPEVSGQFAVNSEGKIQFEFVGDIKIEGMTKDQAAQEISKHLEEYIISPEVTVKITGYNSKIVYVVGEVGQPGKIYMRGDTITVREALMQASLPRLTGKMKKSRLITPSDDGKMEKKLVNVYALIYDGDLRENLTMEPGDVLYIPPTFLTKTMRAISPITAPISNAAGTGRTVMTGF